VPRIDVIKLAKSEITPTVSFLSSFSARYRFNPHTVFAERHERFIVATTPRAMRPSSFYIAVFSHHNKNAFPEIPIKESKAHFFCWAIGITSHPHSLSI
jgi:hypothetical protein